MFIGDTGYFDFFFYILFDFFMKFALRKCFHSIFLSYANRHIKRIYMYLYTYKFALIRLPSSNYSRLTSVATAVRCSNSIGMSICMSNNPLPLSPVGCLPSQCVQVLLAPVRDIIRPFSTWSPFSCNCPPSHQTLWLLTFARPSCGKCGQRIGVFSVL